MEDGESNGSVGDCGVGGGEAKTVPRGEVDEICQGDGRDAEWIAHAVGKRLFPLVAQAAAMVEAMAEPDREARRMRARRKAAVRR
ncbi:hypothetical protein HPP92_007666 [Vanilla planifolia]|uniref:Uncharacterized protein n=1 Tax=Vanilla planifolia TaxID=51239 RepID=A0A835RRC3_VANPL|nr:hypothetical protein HPP92_007666 [Vanilla planifolia]